MNNNRYNLVLSSHNTTAHILVRHNVVGERCGDVLVTCRAFSGIAVWRQLSGNHFEIVDPSAEFARLARVAEEHQWCVSPTRFASDEQRRIVTDLIRVAITLDNWQGIHS